MPNITINGRAIESISDPRKPFLEVLREEFGLRGTKYGCGEGECGACTIIVDGKTACSCLTMTGTLAGTEVTTVEGLGNDPIGVRLFNAFREQGAVQCGFCTPGFVLSAWQFLSTNEGSDTERIRDSLGGNLCRCTGYVRIVDAVRECFRDAVASPLATRRGRAAEPVMIPRVYWRPGTLDELFAQFSSFALDPRMIAGGTDLMVQHEHGLHELALVDLSGVAALSGIEETDAYVRIGATTTWSEIGRSETIARWAPLLRLASAEIGGIQIQNRGTIGGNIANASPAADGLPALYAYDAEIHLASPSGKRSLPIGDFVHGPRRTALAPAEIITDIRLPKTVAQGTPIVFFEKVGPRKAQTITKASVAFHGWRYDGRILDPRIALGAVAPTVVRAREAEQCLSIDSTPEGMQHAARRLSAIATPIDDVRSTAEYRKKLVSGLLLRGLLKNSLARPSECSTASE
jgi:xanthine dehydrogenase iron-sulfur cluster and FAD-binding subunit A